MGGGPSTSSSSATTNTGGTVVNLSRRMDGGQVAMIVGALFVTGLLVAVIIKQVR